MKEFVVLVCAIFIATASASQYAYGTVLYSDDYLVPLLTLGQSINNTGSTADRVALYTSDVSLRTVQIMQEFGWKTKSVKVLTATNTPLHARYANTFTKIRMWELVEYERVIYLDADVLVLRNMDSLFKCGPFCAPVDQMPNQHFCAGTMVLTPSMKTHDELIEAMAEPHPEDLLADQDMFNRFFPVSKMTEGQFLGQQVSFQTAVYWFFNFYYYQIENEMLSIHYTAAKPWNWHNYPFTDLAWKWRAVYVTLPLRTTAGEVMWYIFLITLPILVMLAFVHRIMPRSSKSSSSGGSKPLTEEARAIMEDTYVWTPSSALQVLAMVVGAAAGGISAMMLIPSVTFFMLGYAIMALWLWMGIMLFVFGLARFQLREQWPMMEQPLRRALYILGLNCLISVVGYCLYLLACLRYMEYTIPRHVIMILAMVVYFTAQLWVFTLRPYMIPAQDRSMVLAMIAQETANASGRRGSESSDTGSLSARALSARSKWTSMRPPLY